MDTKVHMYINLQEVPNLCIQQHTIKCNSHVIAYNLMCIWNPALQNLQR